MTDSITKIVNIFILVLVIASLSAGCRVATPVVKTDEEASLKSNPGVESEKIEGTAILRDGASSQGEMGKKIIHKDDGKDDYKIGPGDVLHVSVWNNKELTMDVMVRPDGKISLPLLQDVNARGMTAVELREGIAERLKEFVIEPIVTITVKTVNYPKFFIMGEIRKPGTFPLRENISVLQAISLAGGFTEYASTSNIILIRNTPSGQKRVKINYGKLLKSGAERKNIFLEPGDTIIIP